MGKGEIQHFDLTYNFNDQLKKIRTELLNTDCVSMMDSEQNKFIDNLIKNVKDYLPSIVKKASFQYEIGEKTNNHHLQMRIKTIKPATMSMKDDKGIRALILKGPLAGASISATSAKCVEQNDWNYVKKEQTKVDNHYLFESNKWIITDISGNKTEERNIIPVYIPRQYRDLKFLQWQELVAEIILNYFNSRIINFVYDPIGCRGKSTFAAIMELIHGCIDMPAINDMEKLIATCCDICMGKNIRNPKGIFIDLPRAMDKNKLHGFIGCCEQIKKGKLYDLRNHYKEWWIDSPSIWIFSNSMIDFDLLSKDRWKLWSFTDDATLIEKEIKPEKIPDFIPETIIEDNENTPLLNNKEIITLQDAYNKLLKDNNSSKFLKSEVTKLKIQKEKLEKNHNKVHEKFNSKWQDIKELEKQILRLKEKN